MILDTGIGLALLSVAITFWAWFNGRQTKALLKEWRSEDSYWRREWQKQQAEWQKRHEEWLREWQKRDEEWQKRHEEWLREWQKRDEEWQKRHEEGLKRQEEWQKRHEEWQKEITLALRDIALATQKVGEIAAQMKKT